MSSRIDPAEKSASIVTKIIAISRLGSKWNTSKSLTMLIPKK